jgi:hypothetical protein
MEPGGCPCGQRQSKSDTGPTAQASSHDHPALALLQMQILICDALTAAAGPELLNQGLRVIQHPSKNILTLLPCPRCVCRCQPSTGVPHRGNWHLSSLGHRCSRCVLVGQNAGCHVSALLPALPAAGASISDVARSTQ